MTVHGPIDDLTFLSVVRRTELAIAQGAQAIVLELDTPGGDMLATLQLCNYIKTQMPSNTVAWVRPQAFSAGTIIALATRQILVGPGAAFGDAAPIQVASGVGLIPMPATERAKMEAPLVAEVVDSARKRGYDEHLVQAFVRLGSEYWLIRNRSTRSGAIVDAQEYSELFGVQPPRESVAVAPNAVTEALPADSSFVPFFANFPSTAMLATPTPPIRPSRARFTIADRDGWELVAQVAKSDQLLVVYPDEAIALGLAAARIADERELSAWFGATTLVRYDESWSEVLVRFLTTWPVRIGLIVILLVGAVAEALTPGFGLFGTAAAIALLLLIGAPALVGLAEWWELIAVVLGLGLVALDVAILPMGGWVAILGGAIVLTGLVSSFVTRDLTSAVGQHQLVMGIGTTLAGVFGSATLLWFASKWMPHSALFSRAILQASATSQARDAIQVPAFWPELGTEAVALTTLRPAGRVEIATRPFDAQTSGEFVEPGSHVRVIGRRGTTLEVEPIDLASLRGTPRNSEGNHA